MRTDHVTGALRDKRYGVAVASYLSNSGRPAATGIPKAATEPDEGVVRMIHNLFRLAQSFPLSVVATLLLPEQDKPAPSAATPDS